MKKLIFLLPIFISTVMMAQFNLVPNPSFEVYDTCPSNLFQLRFAIPWTSPISLGSTPDYFNSCDTSIHQWASVPVNQSGFEPAHSGNGYAFIITSTHTAPLAGNYREYIQTKLSDSLLSGVNYCIRFYVSACDSCLYTTNNIGVFFSSVKIDTFTTTYPINLPFVPQFENPSTNNLSNRNGWTKIEGMYTALGNENFIIIGNFRDSNATVDQYTGWGYQHWSGFYIDDVLITPCDSLTNVNNQNTETDIKLYQGSYSQLFISSENLLLTDVIICNALGQNVLQLKNVANQKISIDVSHFPSGFYIINVLSNKGKYVFKFNKS